MKKILVAAILVMALMSSCIGQKKEFTIDDWKKHLAFSDPHTSQNYDWVSGFHNVEELPLGTHIVLNVEFEGTAEETEMWPDTTVGLTISGREAVDGIDCTVIEYTMDMEIETFGEKMILALEGTGWVDETGGIVKTEGTAEEEFRGKKRLGKASGKRTGEEQYHGHDCWVFTTLQSTEVAGVPATEEEVVQYTEYMDKESHAVVRMITKVLGEEIDTGYIEPEIPSFGELQWKLGDRETITTEMGTYQCQIIYLKENDEPGETGETVGTIWANEEIRVPLKYVISLKTEGAGIEMVMTLIEYTLGE